ncbi:hypothetical protein K435DRAFT_861216 [Dendrothele bispora CBS 962.96]|uniref:Uncharacterized protein n=1 Tax=Dendrothele bispora (strain CBS 962.96) TaxID=1314807 RepID=A0A4S8LVY5_DENBC|nr:hypothetical protein K435DRAFT_861216 [Dendrothele bispora CBS 962.96]
MNAAEKASISTVGTTTTTITEIEIKDTVEAWAITSINGYTAACQDSHILASKNPSGSQTSPKTRTKALRPPEGTFAPRPTFQHSTHSTYMMISFIQPKPKALARCLCSPG